MEHPLRDHGLSYFQSLDESILARLYCFTHPRGAVPASKKDLAIEVFLSAHEFGTFTLTDVVGGC